MGKMTHSLRMSADSWHAQWYKHWVSLGGKPSPYKENLCRYVRILLFYAPGRWIAARKIFDINVLVYLGGLSALLLIGFGIRQYPAAMEYVGIGLAVLVLVVAVIIAIAYGFKRLEEKRQDEDIAVKAVKPIRPPGRLRLKLRPYYRRIMRCIGLIREFGGFVIVGGVVLFVLGAICYTAYKDPWGALIVVGGIVGLLAVVVGILLLIAFASKKGFWYHVSDTISLGYTYVSTKKKGSRICPFIEFEDEQAPKSQVQ